MPPVPRTCAFALAAALLIALVAFAAPAAHPASARAVAQHALPSTYRSSAVFGEDPGQVRVEGKVLSWARDRRMLESSVAHGVRVTARPGKYRSVVAAVPGLSRVHGPLLAGFALPAQLRLLLARPDLVSEVVSDPKVALPEGRFALDSARRIGMPVRSQERNHVGVPLSSSAGSLAATEAAAVMYQSVEDFDPYLAEARRLLFAGDRPQYRAAVAIVDTGIDDRHPALAGLVRRHVDFTTRDPSCSPGPSQGKWDDLGHGTHVAGIVASTGRVVPGGRRYGFLEGVAPGVPLVDLKVFDCREESDSSVVDAALAWILEHHLEYGIEVVNMSLGYEDEAKDGTDPTSRLVNQLQAAGISVVVAAGNSGSAPGTLSSPATALHATTVGAANAGARGEFLAGFSSRGPTSDGRPGVDLVAPGVSVLSSVPDRQWEVASGTSMAAPYVAGTLALLASAPDPPPAPSGISCVPFAAGPRDCLTGVVDSSMSDPRADLLAEHATAWLGPEETGEGMVRAAASVRAAAGKSVPLPYPDATVLEADLSSGPLRVLVDTDLHPAAATVHMPVPMPSTLAPTATWRDTEARDVPGECLSFLSWHVAQCSDFEEVTRTSGSFTVAGTGASAVEIEGSGIPGPLRVQVLVTGAVVAPAPAVSAQAVSSAWESRSPGQVLLERTAPAARPSRWVMSSPDPRVATAEVTLPAGPAGTAVRLSVPVSADEDPDGRNPAALFFAPETPDAPLAVPLPVRDPATGYPRVTRLSLPGGTALPSGASLEDINIAGSTTLAAVRDPVRAVSLGYQPGWFTYLAVAGPDGVLRELHLAPKGGYPGAQVSPLALSADGSTALMVMFPAGAGLLPGDESLAMELFVHDMRTGRNTRVGPSPRQSALYSWQDAYSLTRSRMSPSGRAIAYVDPDPSRSVPRVVVKGPHGGKVGAASLPARYRGALTEVVGLSSQQAVVVARVKTAEAGLGARETVRVLALDLRSGKVQDVFARLTGKRGVSLHTAVSSPSGRFVAAASAGRTWLADTRTGEVTRLRLREDFSQVTALSDSAVLTLANPTVPQSWAWAAAATPNLVSQAAFSFPLVDAHGIPAGSWGHSSRFAPGDTTPGFDATVGIPPAPVRSPGASRPLPARILPASGDLAPQVEVRIRAPQASLWEVTAFDDLLGYRVFYSRTMPLRFEIPGPPRRLYLEARPYDADWQPGPVYRATLRR